MKQFLILSLFFLSNCTAKVEEETAVVQIKSVSGTNQGTPIYVLFKSTDFPHFLTDDYKKIAHQKMLSADDPDTLASAFFIPGETKTFELKSPKNKSIAVYFIFTHPGEEWKYILTEKETNHVKILLGEDQIAAVSSF